jgi:hypothetical protein
VLEPGGAFGPGAPRLAGNLIETTATQSNELTFIIAQNALPNTGVNRGEENAGKTESSVVHRDAGPTANVLLLSGDALEQTIGGGPGQEPRAIREVPAASSEGPETLTGTEDDPPLVYALAGDGPPADVLILTSPTNSISGNGGIVVLREIADLFQSSKRGEFLTRMPEIRFADPFVTADRGTIFDAAKVDLLQTGFVIGQEEGSLGITERKSDNFLFLELTPLEVLERHRDRLRTRFDVRGGKIVERSSGEPVQPLEFAGAILDIEENFEKIFESEDSAILFAKELIKGQKAEPLEIDSKTASRLGTISFGSGLENLLIKVNEPTDTGGTDKRRAERFVFAAGDVDGDYVPVASLDRFSVTAGALGFDKRKQRTVGETIRAFLRKESAPGLNLVDSGVLVVNRGPEGITARDAATQVVAQVLHADFGLKGGKSDQASTISATIGEVRRVATEDGTGHDAILVARTLGSTREGAGRGSVSIESPLDSTAAGGGNPDLSSQPGKPGYFVVQNFQPKDSAPAGGPASSLGGGTERPVGGDAAQRFALLRLLTGTKTDGLGRKAGEDGERVGFAGGLAEVEQGSSIGLRDLAPEGSDPNLSLTPDLTKNLVSGRLVLGGAAELTLGGEALSAYVNRHELGLRSPEGGGNEIALITSGLVDGGKGNVLGIASRDEHVQWGFFFGDRLAEGWQEHVHLGTWVAGKLPTDLSWTGKATYAGSMIGNVLDQGRLATATGSYSNSWDFGERRGSFDADFDGAKYTGSTRLTNPGKSAGFDGTFASGARRGKLAGSFFGDVTSSGGGKSPAAQGGRFSIADKKAGYRASGVLVGKKKK